VSSVTRCGYGAGGRPPTTVRPVRQRRLPSTTMHPADRDRTVAAMRTWAAEHGRLPTRHGWEGDAPGRPSTRTIDRRWGWQKLLEEATGHRPDLIAEEELEARRRQMLLTLRAACDELGRWPTTRKWDQATPTHASRRTYARHFGSWEAACRAAAGVRAEGQAAPDLSRSLGPPSSAVLARERYSTR
jgi:hypothetical protein